MSATNRTENYNLPIFIETDKPAWLVDFNGAMRSIDAQMKLNAEAIATKSPILTFQDTADIDFTKTGDIITANLQSAITDKVGRALVTPLAAPASDQIVGIDTNGNQENLTIGKGLYKDSGILHAADFNLSDRGNGSISGLPSGVTRLGTSEFSYAFNSDGSIGKIYGTTGVNKAASGDVVITFNTGIRLPVTPSEEFTINPIGFSASSTYIMGGVSLTCRTDGYVYCNCWVKGAANTYIYVMPCILFLTDFGDEPISA